LDAELILAHVLGLQRLDLYLQFDRPLKSQELDAFKIRLKRRAAREPLQYVLGKTTFRELELWTDSRALIPRPETEMLVEEVLNWARTGESGLTVLDVGTGTGAIVLSLLKEGPFVKGVASDSSSQALDLARENAQELGMAGSVEFRGGAGFEAVGDGERFNVIVSNPPYIPSGDRDSLQEEITGWEPADALFAGPEGLDVLLPLARNGASYLYSRGLLALEVGENQASIVAEAMKQTRAFQDISVKPDLSGRDRMVLGVASD
jgi:release factor glutamine methyltransferase